MKNYGMPYKGSKNKIAEKIISVLPEADYFVDLFGGGGAMSHCAVLSGKYKKVIYNELEPLVYKGFVMAVNGEFENEKRWISREEFHRLKDTDPYAAMCFSFGNNLRSYAYAPEIERFKKHLHNIFFAETPKVARMHWKAFIREFLLVKGEISVLTKKALKTCAECEIEPIYNKDGTLNAMKIKANVFKAKSAHIREYMRSALEESGRTAADVDRHLGTNGMAGHYFGTSQWMLPTVEAYKKMCEIIPQLVVPWAELNEQLSVLKTLDELQSLERLQSLQSLESLQSLQSLQSLERLERLKNIKNANNIECLNLSYENVEIPENSVVYCDIPYKNTEKYISDFNHEKFYSWAKSQPFTVYISEYSMPEGFQKIASFTKNCTLDAYSNKKTVEKLFINKAVKI